MSHKKLCGVIAAVTVALALAGGAYGDAGKNGPPGPAGNPNQPTSQPQANAPQGPAGNSGASATAKSGTHGSSTAAHAKAKTHSKSQASHGNSVATNAKTKSHAGNDSHPTQSHANTTPGTPRKGGREDRPAGKITICHATKSVKNPYVEITISVNGLHGHGPAEDPHHHPGSWKDIIPAPAGGCPSTVPNDEGSALHQDQQSTPTPTSTTSTTSTTGNATVVAPEVTTPAPAAAAQEVLGARAAGGSTPATDVDASSPGESKVLGARASGTAPAAALAARRAANRGGTLPFTGSDLVFVLLLAAVALLGGFALRRATVSGRGRA